MAPCWRVTGAGVAHHGELRQGEHDPSRCCRATWPDRTQQSSGRLVDDCAGSTRPPPTCDRAPGPRPADSPVHLIQRTRTSLSVSAGFEGGRRVQDASTVWVQDLVAGSHSEARLVVSTGSANAVTASSTSSKLSGSRSARSCRDRQANHLLCASWAYPPSSSARGVSSALVLRFGMWLRHGMPHGRFAR